MNKKKWIIVGLLLGVGICIDIFVFKHLFSKKPPTEPATTEVVIPEAKFEYVKVSILDKEVECKYAKFDQPLNAHRLKGILGVDPNTKIQWLQYLKYTALTSDSPREFNPEMHNPDRKDRIEFFREKWNKTLASREKFANAILGQKEEDLQLEEILKGILFVSYDQVEYAIFTYQHSPKSNRGEVAVVHNKKLIWLDDEIYKPDFKFLLNFFGEDQDKIIEKLSQSEHGILTVKDPLNWNLR